MSWQPSRWWRVLDQSPEGIWCETSDEDEARAKMRPGDVLQRLFRKEETEWRDVE